MENNKPGLKQTSNQALQLSKQQQQTDALEKLLKATTARFPHDPISTLTSEAWMRDWARMIERVGMQRFTLGLQEACLHSKYFPLPGVILDHIPEPVEKLDDITQEMRDLQRRAAAGEKFYGMADLAEVVREKFGVNGQAKKLDPLARSKDGRDTQ